MDRKELLSRLRESEAELSQLRLKSTELANSREAVMKIDRDLDARLQLAEEAHATLLEELVTGIATDEQVEASQVKIKGIKKEIRRNLELIDASSRAGQDLPREIARTNSKIAGLKHHFWGDIRTELLAQVNKKTYDLIARAWVCGLLGGGAGLYEAFLERIFSRPGVEQIGDIKEMLIGEFMAERAPRG